MSHLPTLTAYGDRADEYAALLGSIKTPHLSDRKLIAGWAEGVCGEILDVGCGPGHWSAFLHGRGAVIRGIDPVKRFIEIASGLYPDVEYSQGSFSDLEPESADGILAWYSLIHMEEYEVVEALQQCHTALCPEGTLLVGFFEGPQHEKFGHAVCPAFFWPVSQMCLLLDRSGFVVEQTSRRHDSGARPHGAIVARRR